MSEQGRGFRIGACLGRGGFGEVYRATWIGPTGIETEVALKVLRRDVDPDSQAVQRLRDEGRLLARLQHPAILRVLDLVVLEGRAALVSEFVDGEDLAGIFQAGPMPVRPLLECVGAVAGALDLAWRVPVPGGGALELVHRDIKPANIRISRFGDTKVLDFGIARTDQVDREARTATDMMIGSPPYMAPERFTSSKTLLSSDIFALGATLYEGIVGQRLFEGQSVTMLAALAIREERFAAFVAERLQHLVDVPERLGALIGRMLAFDPAARPTPGELAVQVEELVDEIRGPTLARWARDRTWPEQKKIKGELENRYIDTAVGSAATGPTLVAGDAERSGRAGRWWVAALGMVGVVGAGAGLTAIAVVLVGGLAWLQPAAVAPAAVPPPVQTPAPEPAIPPPTVAPAPVAAPAPPPAPVPAPAPVVSPKPGRPAAPAPPPPAPVAAPPAPAASASELVRFTVSPAEQVVEARGPRTLRVPGMGPPGSYEVWATFPAAGVVRVCAIADARAGETVAIDCPPRMQGQCKCSRTAP